MASAKVVPAILAELYRLDSAPQDVHRHRNADNAGATNEHLFRAQAELGGDHFCGGAGVHHSLLTDGRVRVTAIDDNGARREARPMCSRLTMTGAAVTLFFVKTAAPVVSPSATRIVTSNTSSGVSERIPA